MKLGTSYKLILGLIFVGCIIAGFEYANMHGLIPDLSMVKMYRMDIEGYLMKNLLFGVVVFALIYMGAVALSLPIATPLTLLGGFIFGTVLGSAVVAIAATTGATVSVVINRFFFKDAVRAALGARLEKIDHELGDHGFRDIFVLRLTPLVPFSLINLGSAVTNVRIKDFFFATLFGALPFTIVYVNAGTRLAAIESVKDIVSLPTLIAVSLLVVAVSVPVLLRHRRKEALHSQHEAP